MTTLELTPHETESLQAALRAHLERLNREIARTDAREYRQALREEESILGKLLARLSHASAA